MKKHFSLALCFCLFSLSLLADTASHFKTGYDILPQEEPEPVLHDVSKTQDVSGFLPETIHLRTLTQSYCKYYEFALVDGRIYAKKAGSDKWELFLKTGLPFKSPGGDKFDAPRAIREISCDADSLYAFDDQGILYTIFFKKIIRQKLFTWRVLSGFPRSHKAEQNELVVRKRGWSMGARRDDILWYEDRYGNQHHWGTMGLETFYFLTEDGQHIRFSDSGLPPDFSRSIECPEKGSFIAENISVSGSTIFLIGNRGTMYTRLIDFDTMGCDPMFFLYTYDVENQKERGRDYLSNYTAWALPAEDWAKQPPIPLEGKARLTKMISIAQTGQGNYARELRVAGCDRDGTIGYWHKMLYGQTWTFVPANLVLDDSVWLDPSREEYGQPQTFTYEGCLTKNGVKVEGIRCSLEGPTLSSEDRCSLKIQMGDESFTCRLFPVEKWTYILRYDPGFDGTPRYYFMTPELDERKLEGYSAPFREILSDLFKGMNHSLFAYSAVATTEHYEIDLGVRGGSVFQGGNSYMVLMTKDGKDIQPFAFRGSALLFQEGSGLESPMEEKYLLEEGRTYTEADRPLIANRIAANVNLAKKLQKEIQANIISYDNAELSRWGYNLLDMITRVTFLNKLNVPKIKQMTSFGRDLMGTNAALYRDLLAYSEWTYPPLLELVELRIKYYQKLLTVFEKGGQEATLPAGFHNSFIPYYDDIGLSAHLAGGEDSMDLFSVDGLLPWFMIQKGDGSSILLRLDDSARAILDGGKKIRIPAAFTVVSGQSGKGTSFPDGGRKDLSNIESYEGEFLWDGSEAKVYLKDSVFGKKTVFRGRKTDS